MSQITREIDGALFQSMFIEGALAIAEKKEQTNELNVFPVPDGDTGTNMSMTMASAMQALRASHTSDLKEKAETVASALLRGARGNSGVILSLLFRGMSKVLKGAQYATTKDFALALAQGVETAYKAVMKPVEGTILTVSRMCAKAAQEVCHKESDVSFEHLFETMIARGDLAVQETQEQNPVLKKAGVVDAGGYGWMTILKGMQDALLGIHHAEVEVQDSAPKGADFAGISDEEINFTYCTEFIVERRDKSRSPDRLRTFLAGIGDSLVVVDDDDIIKVHVHTDEPDKALGEGLKFGPLVTVKIENMRQQHTEKVIEGTAYPRKEERTIAEPTKPYGFVVVSSGEGLSQVFQDLGADEIVQGGQTMNPSTSDLLRAIDATPAHTVYVLPNNKNIIMAAEQTIDLSEKKVIVLPTTTIPQGISAMLAFDASAEADENTKTMQTAMRKVQSGQVTYAARNSEFDGKKIKRGEYMSLCNGKLCANSKKIEDTLKKLAKELVQEDSTFATLFYGNGISETDAQHAATYFQKENKEMEVSVMYGGQDVYYYIVSVE